MVTASEKKLDAAIAEVFSHFDLLPVLNPINLEKEKKRFFEQRGSNPIFKYAPVPKEQIARDIKKISSLQDVEGEFAPLLVACRDELIATLELSSLVGTPQFAAQSAKIFELPSEEATLRARRILERYRLRNFKKKKAKFLLAYEAKDRALDYLQEIGLEGVKVEIRSGHSVRVAVARKSNTVYIAAGSKFGPSSLPGVLAHEIGVHVIRGTNAKVQPLEIFAIGTAAYLGTEEGLAAIARKMVTDNPYFVSTSYFVIAADIGSRASFRETYNVLRKLGASVESAWKYTFRVKRGLGDTSKPGVFAKDAQYLLGVFEIEKFLKAGGKLQDLFVGKIKPADLSVLKDSTDIAPAKFFPPFFKDAETKVLDLIAKNS